MSVSAQVIQSWTWSPNSGQNNEFVDAVSKKTQKYNSKKDEPRFVTLQITSGSSTGDYFRFRIEDEIKDFDNAPDERGQKMWMDTAVNFASMVTSEWWQVNQRASYWQEGDNNFIKPLKRFFNYTYDGENEADFWAFRYKVKGAIEESGADITMTTLTCFAGCSGNQVMVIFSHNNFEDLQNDNSSEWAKVYEKYNETYGVSYESDIAEFERSLTLGSFGRYSGTMMFSPEMSSPQNMN